MTHFDINRQNLQNMLVPAEEKRIPAEKCFFVTKDAIFQRHIAGNQRKMQDNFRVKKQEVVY